MRANFKLLGAVSCLNFFTLGSASMGLIPGGQGSQEQIIPVIQVINEAPIDSAISTPTNIPSLKSPKDQEMEQLRQMVEEEVKTFAREYPNPSVG